MAAARATACSAGERAAAAAAGDAAWLLALLPAAKPAAALPATLRLGVTAALPAPRTGNGSEPVTPKRALAPALAPEPGRARDAAAAAVMRRVDRDRDLEREREPERAAPVPPPLLPTPPRRDAEAARVADRNVEPVAALPGCKLEPGVAAAAVIGRISMATVELPARSPGVARAGER